jgi:integrase
VQAFATGLSHKGLAPLTVRNIYSWVKAAFASAVEDRIVAASPCTRRVVLPTVEKPRIVPLTVAQVRLLAEAAPERYRIGVYLQAALGLRISELLALQVSDVDFLRRTVRVERQLDKNGRDFVGLKYDSRRSVPLARDLVPLLARHLQMYPPTRDGVILSTTHGNPIRSDYYSDSIFKRAVATADIPTGITSHGLRHHFASVLLSRGVPTNVVAEYLGHSSSRLVEDTYGHLMPDAEDVTRQALDGLWQPEALDLRKSGSAGVAFSRVR